MSNQRNQSNVKVCNHKPGDNWTEEEGGCCGDEQPKNKSSELTKNPVQEEQESDSDSVLIESEPSPISAT
ncbi:MAG: hypothetical protein QNJ63_19180 [Calothrix sp. MO_192.B10]|nr:hypothetical protein [Calothrix sp. MO_192.B10]